MAENSTRTARRGPGRPFQPGKSGNPGGRPKQPPELREVFAGASLEAARYLAELVSDESADPRLRLDAARAVLDRHLGRPAPAQPPDEDKPADRLQRFLDALAGAQEGAEGPPPDVSAPVT